MTIESPTCTHTYLMQQSKEAQGSAASLLDYCSVQGSMVTQQLGDFLPLWISAHCVSV